MRPAVIVGIINNAGDTGNWLTSLDMRWGLHVAAGDNHENEDNDDVNRDEKHQHSCNVLFNSNILHISQWRIIMFFIFIVYCVARYVACIL